MENNAPSTTTIVLKFGGASLATPTHIKEVATLIQRKRMEGSRIVVVTSAMGKTTDNLLELAHDVSDNPVKRELDMLVSVGERVSMSLLAMALYDLGIEARSFTGSQAGIITSERHQDAQILDVKPRRLEAELAKGCVVIVAGFQGVSGGEITTLGRSGSDTSAVALGIALGATRVEFYKDVSGVFCSDPKRNPSAVLHNTLTFDRALSLANGDFVLQKRALLLAKKNGMKLVVKGFDQGGAGTEISDQSLPKKSGIEYEDLVHVGL